MTYDAAGNTVQDARGSTPYGYTIHDSGRIEGLTVGTTPTALYSHDAKERRQPRCGHSCRPPVRQYPDHL